MINFIYILVSNSSTNLTSSWNKWKQNVEAESLSKLTHLHFVLKQGFVFIKNITWVNFNLSVS